jgi:hypothetical protein
MLILLAQLFESCVAAIVFAENVDQPVEIDGTFAVHW